VRAANVLQYTAAAAAVIDRRMDIILPAADMSPGEHIFDSLRLASVETAMATACSGVYSQPMHTGSVTLSIRTLNVAILSRCTMSISICQFRSLSCFRLDLPSTSFYYSCISSSIMMITTLLLHVGDFVLFVSDHSFCLLRPVSSSLESLRLDCGQNHTRALVGQRCTEDEWFPWPSRLHHKHSVELCSVDSRSWSWQTERERVRDSRLTLWMWIVSWFDHQYNHFCGLGGRDCATWYLYHDHMATILSR